ncbi:hypothetical protein V8F20_006508 [Naviculisporaceae sp. PSN 640]
MEKSRNRHQSSKRRVHDDRDKQAHKSRHDLLVSQPHKSRPRSPERLVDGRELGSRSKPPTDQNDYLTSWLRAAYPHRNHPPDLESVVKETRERKRARASLDFSESADEDHMPSKTSFEKRPRHKTHPDKYDYKEGPGRKRKPPREERVVDLKGRRRNEHVLGPTRPSQKENSHGKHVKKGSQKVPDSHQRPIETSPEPEPSPPRLHRSSKRRDNGARFDKDLQEINEFFGRKTHGNCPKVGGGRRSPTPSEEQDPSEPPRTPSSGIGDDNAHLRKPWYSDSARGSYPKKSPSIDQSTDILTWLTSEYPPKSLAEHGKFSEQQSESPERTRPEKKRETVPTRSRERQSKVSQSQEKRRDSRSSGIHREGSSQMPPPPSPISYRRQKENVPPRCYVEPYHYSQRTPVEDPYDGLVGNNAMSDWHHRPPPGLGLSSFKWQPVRAVTRPLLMGHGLDQNQILPRSRGFGQEGRLSDLDPSYFPHPSQAEFLPGAERSYTLDHMDAPNTRYPLEETLITPNEYGYGTIEPVNRVSGIRTRPSLYSQLETRNPPGLEYNIHTNDVAAPAYYSAEPVENPRKQLKRMKRQDYVERLEQETLGTLESLPALDVTEFQHRGPTDLSIQPEEPSSKFDLGDLGGRQSVLAGGIGQVITSRNPLPHLSAGLLTPTHGFTPLTPPVMPESRIRKPFKEDCLSTIWERQSET